ncbi:MAG: dual specificity protein phosphatase family protein [Gammaproteobacteria bacterium]
MASDGPGEINRNQLMKSPLILSQLNMQNIDVPGWIEFINFIGSFSMVTCGWRALTGYHWNEILAGNAEEGPLFLSALPIKTKVLWKGAHHEKILEQCRLQNHALGLVVSMVQNFELRGYGLPIYPVSAEDWAAYGVQQLQCPMADFTDDISLHQLKVLADRIHEARRDGVGDDRRKGVLVHCKAGVARSMTVVWAYLVLHGGFSIEGAEALLIQKRPQVAITASKRALIARFAAEYSDKAPEYPVIVPLVEEPPPSYEESLGVSPAILSQFNRSLSEPDLKALSEEVTLSMMEPEQTTQSQQNGTRLSFSR